MGGGGDGGYSKDTSGICTEDDEGSTERWEEHDNGGGRRLGIWIRLNEPGLNDFPQPPSHRMFNGDEKNGLCGVKRTKSGLTNLKPNPQRYPVTSGLRPILMIVLGVLDAWMARFVPTTITGFVGQVRRQRAFIGDATFPSVDFACWHPSYSQKFPKSVLWNPSVRSPQFDGSNVAGKHCIDPVRVPIVLVYPLARLLGDCPLTTSYSWGWDATTSERNSK